jgi:hypothetical protein
MDREFDAQVSFFDYYGLTAPDVPLLSAEFSNPLFLKVLCKSLLGLAAGTQKQRWKEFAAGQKGMTYVLERFVKHVGGPIESDFYLPGNACWKLLKGSSQGPGIAGLMAQKGRHWLSRDQAIASIAQQLTVENEMAADILERLITDGILNETVHRLNSEPVEVVEAVEVAYQRFGDHLIARHLLEKHLDTGSEETIRRCFYANRPLGAPFRLSQWGHEFESPGVAAALMLELPERLKQKNVPKELVSYIPKARRLLHPIKGIFLDGLYFRGESAFVDDTHRMVLQLLRDSGDDVAHETLEVLVGLASRGSHGYNSYWLRDYLAAFPMNRRDMFWSEFVRQRNEYSSLHRFITWVETTEGAKTSRGRAGYQMVLLSLALTTTDRTLRDRLTRALVYLGVQHPQIIFEETLESLKFNDPYIPERMLAASFGVAVRLWADPDRRTIRRPLVLFARQLVRLMFLPGAPHPTAHTLIDGYARGIIDLSRHTDQNAIATQHVHQLKQKTALRASPFKTAAQITDEEIAGAAAATRMDFSNHTVGRLIPDRAAHQSTTDYENTLKQIQQRMVRLGYDSDRFEDADTWIETTSWNREEGKVDRYGKKYSWVAYFEMCGVRKDRGALPRRRPPTDTRM